VSADVSPANVLLAYTAHVPSDVVSGQSLRSSALTVAVAMLLLLQPVHLC
jgi:hypothetical protein